MTKALPFQVKTIEVVLRAFRASRGSRRYLVADEVGLGKTVVAQHVLKGLMDDRHRQTAQPLVVFYVCSNLTIARQNREQLLKVLDTPAERRSAVCLVDRLTLLPAHKRPAHPRLHLYSLTPDTSLPMRHGRARRDGRQDERALIEALLSRLWPGAYEALREQYGERVFRCRAEQYWDVILERAHASADDARLRDEFSRAARSEFGVDFGMRIKTALLEQESSLHLIAKLRNALAASALSSLQPDLVIFDEFQRFRDLVASEIDEGTSTVLRQLRGEGATGSPPALLLLSATPYRFYSRRSDDAAGQTHHEEFYDLIRFLYGGKTLADTVDAKCRRAFGVIQKELLRGEPSSPVAAEARVLVQNLLRPVMARTERSSHPDADRAGHTDEYPAHLTGADVRVYRHLNTCLQPEHRGAAVPYWTSIPLPMQSMGSRYLAWKAVLEADVTTSEFTEKACNRFQRKVWPHPRLRALKELAPPEKLALPWLPPSLPWWPLEGLWKPAGGEPASVAGEDGAEENGLPRLSLKQSSKLLVFSRFRAAPQAMSALLSYDLEAHLMHGPGKRYRRALARRLLSATAERPGVFASFFPAPWLVRETEPLLAARRTAKSAMAAVRRQIRRYLKEVGIEIGARGGSPRSVWKLLAGIERTLGSWKSVHRACQDLHARTSKGDGQDAGFAALLDVWAAIGEITSITVDELDALARHAVAAPGVALGRALRRHWNEAVAEENFPAVLEASWLGLRSYLDNPLFEAAFGAGGNYRAALHRAVRHGNLESVLDEHLWISQRLGGGTGAELANTLRDALKLHVGRVEFHGAQKRPEIRLRCHAAMPFIEARAGALREADELGEEKPLRTDELKKAFNTPFWPHVLSTTSVGQEGLDFHTWCSTLVHWDLCSSPVDLEQREGRIQRFGGLAIRRAIAATLSGEVWPERREWQSPWECLANLADKRLQDDSGLKPWWLLPGAEIRRYVFDLAGSEQANRFSDLKQQRMLYRLVMGQPNQEDLVEHLKRIALDATVSDDRASIQLSPFYSESGPFLSNKPS